MRYESKIRRPSLAFLVAAPCRAHHFEVYKASPCHFHQGTTNVMTDNLMVRLHANLLTSGLDQQPKIRRLPVDAS